MFKESLICNSMSKNSVGLSNSDGISIEIGFCSTHSSSEDIDGVQNEFKFIFGKLSNFSFSMSDEGKIYNLIDISLDKFSLVSAIFERKVPNKGIYTLSIKAPLCWFKDHFDNIDLNFKLNINQEL